MMIPAAARVSAAKPPPPPSTGSSFARAYSVPYSYSVAESISQASSGGFAVGALCSAEAATTPNCNGPATVMRVDSSGNIQSQTQYSYGNGSQSTALNILKATSDGGAIFAGQPQSGCPAQNLKSCGEIVKVDSTGKVQWANDLLFATCATPYSPPKTWPFDVQQTTDGGFVLVGYAIAPGAELQSVDCQIELHRAITVDAPIRRPEQSTTAQPTQSGRQQTAATLSGAW